jgi:thioester reductase-like protein
MPRDVRHQRPPANDPAEAERLAGIRRDVRRFASERLVSAMVPSRFVVVDDLPRLPNGKVDRRGLGAGAVPETPLAETADHVAPETPAEVAAAELWADLLGRERIGVTADFFDLGGTSVTAVRMAARWTARTGVPIDLERFQEQPTIRSMLRSSGADTGVLETGGAGDLDPSMLAGAAVLPPDIRAAGPGGQAVPPYRSILVTDGLGLVGSAVVRQLLERPGSVVHVLVPSANEVEGRALLRRAMTRPGPEPAHHDRLLAVPGDLSRPYLGLTPHEYRRLSAEVQSVVHCGGVADYRVSPRRLFPANVLGTQEVLRFAASGTTRPVHFVSLLDLAPSGVEGGLRQSRWLGERYMRQAAERGIPTRVYRHGQIVTSPDEGSLGGEDFLTALIKTCISLRMAPDLELWFRATPISLLASTLAEAALHDGAPAGTLDVAAGASVSWRELVTDVRSSGRVLDTVPYARWRRTLLETVAAGDVDDLTSFIPLIGADGLSGALGLRAPSGPGDDPDAAGESGAELLRTYPSRISGFSGSQTGIVVRDHTIAVPLDHREPNGPSIELFAREVVAADRETDDLPWLLFLQGGPGAGVPRPSSATGWMGPALRTHRVLLLDQRGCGRSTPITAETMAGRTPSEMVAHLRRFRADSIVADAELLRARVAGGRRWSILGQSYGGFIALTYLSTAPEGLDTVFVSGGLPGLHATARDVYARTFAQAVRKNAAHHERHPEDAGSIRRLADYLDANDVRLSNGDRLTSRRMRVIGRLLGQSDGSDRIHRLFAEAWDGANLSETFQRAMLHHTTDTPLFAMQESIYARRGHATRWAAHRVLADFPEFGEEREPLLLYTEMMFPWMFREASQLRPFADAADLMAEAADLPDLYDPDRLARNEVPLFAVLYADDVYTPNDLQLETARTVANVHVLMTDEFHHNGLMRNGTLMARLLDMARSARELA